MAGIGQDMCTALNQKQSRSANSDYLVTMALGSAVETTNAANTNAFTNDLAYLVWGNDNGVTTFNTAVSGTNVNSRLGRVWKVQKSANWDDNQDITLCFNGGYNEENYLIISDANTFATLDLEQALDANGCIAFNSALLEDGDFFSLGVEVSGPACVNPGISMWLRADAGTVDGTSWLDQSGKNVNATGVNPPTLTTGAINFNPAMVFDGTNDYMTLSSLDVLPYNSSNRTIIGIGYSANVTGVRSIMSYGTATNNTNQRIGQNAAAARYSSGTVAGQFVDVAGFWTANAPSILSTSYEDLATDVASIYKDGKSLSNTNITTPWNTASSGAAGRIGANAAASAAEFWSGGIGELIIYDRILSALELQQVHSYLSLKYGITLDQTVAQDYVASDGLTLMWEAAANGSYNHDLSGIGLDGCTGLNQKQSRSVNGDAVITMGLGSIEVDNSSNSNVFDADLSFLVWGNNNGSLSEITTDLPAQFSVGAYRLAREWKVDETNNVGSAGKSESEYATASRGDLRFGSLGNSLADRSGWRWRFHHRSGGYYHRLGLQRRDSHIR
ncbi:MAG: hypothetical protein IPJ74_19440 [Saprospiraceae bacterium]|nr:hypothetical protein [Saprospiraceae bacterium]